MSIKVKFYGWPRDVIGSSEVEINPGGRSVLELLKVIDKDGKVVRAVKEDRLFVVVNHSKAVNANFKPKDGDIIAIFPEPSGG